MASVQYRKLAPAQPSYVLYTASKPAEWQVLVDGIARGRVWGVVSQYSPRPYFRAEVDGVQLTRSGYGRLKDAKRDVERLFA